MAAAALAAARDTASPRIETYTGGSRGGRGRCRLRSRAVSLSSSGSSVARPDLTRKVLGSDLESPARESEWEESEATPVGLQARRHPRVQAGRKIPTARDCEAATRKRGS